MWNLLNILCLVNSPELGFSQLPWSWVQLTPLKSGPVNSSEVGVQLTPLKSGSVNSPEVSYMYIYTIWNRFNPNRNLMTLQD
jgi:hypothetical protein